MTPYYADDWLIVHEGDCRAVLAEMPAESVNCVVTSPPYWGLRDYGTATWDGGDPECDHLRPVQNRNDRPAGAFHGGSDDGNDSREPRYKGACQRCGATRQDSQLGLEPTPDEYVANLVAVFREVRRVLRSDGTVWLNLGDSYSGPPPGASARNSSDGLVGRGNAGRVKGDGTTLHAGLKPKDLVGIPWRVAFALQADGWYLRSDIIWSKPNPMPESVTDRPTKSHEYLFLLAKSPRYYFDAAAVAESARYAGPNGAQHSPYGQGFTRRSEQRAADFGMLQPLVDAGMEIEIRAPEQPPTWAERKAAGATAGNVGVSETYQNGVHGEGLSHELGDGGLSRNIRSVWTIATQPYPGAHFATFPRKLVEPCILAGCPEGGTVLDPFAGSGTTALVAQSLSRRAVLIDLNADYLIQAMARNRDIPLGLAG